MLRWRQVVMATPPSLAFDVPLEIRYVLRNYLLDLK